MPRCLFAAALVVLASTGPIALSSGAVVADHAAADEFTAVPAVYFEQIRDHYRFFYGHTSHGSQVCTGLDMLAQEDPTLYADVVMTEYYDDLGADGDLTWVPPTRNYLDNHPECNGVLWSWCGGCSDNTPEGIDAYLQAMTQLELDYPDVVFVYMTGHLDGSGPEGVLYRNNNQIRDYCLANAKILFDFADIESWDPDGNYYPDDTDACNWCADWCALYSCPSCSNCAHSHCFNCYRKGKAFWWMMARTLGWVPGVDVPPAGGDRLELAPAWPNPFNPAVSLRFTLPRPGPARLDILDTGGRVVAVLMDGPLVSGRHQCSWRGRDRSGHAVPAGVYFARLESGGEWSTRKVVLIK